MIFDYLWTKVSLGIAKTDFVKKIFDFEIMSFGLYMFVECLYLIIYSLVRTSDLIPMIFSQCNRHSLSSTSNFTYIETILVY